MSYLEHFPDLDLYCKSNTNYREVITTTETMQVVVMSIPNGQNIGMETHDDITQFFKIVKGTGVASVDGRVYKLYPGDMLVVPPGALHDVTSRSKAGLKLTTIYSPPEHPPNTIQKFKV